jgi:hypothetical protein
VPDRVVGDAAEHVCELCVRIGAIQRQLKNRSSIPPAIGAMKSQGLLGVLSADI